MVSDHSYLPCILKLWIWYQNDIRPDGFMDGSKFVSTAEFPGFDCEKVQILQAFEINQLIILIFILT